MKNIETKEQEKKLLLFCKEQLENFTHKIDLSNIYVWEINGVYNIVIYEVKSIKVNEKNQCYQSTLIDVFSNNIIYEKKSVSKIEKFKYIVEEDYFASLTPLCEIDNLSYCDNKVPLYFLHQLYYKLNNINVNPYLMESATKKIIKNGIYYK